MIAFLGDVIIPGAICQLMNVTLLAYAVRTYAWTGKCVDIPDTLLRRKNISLKKSKFAAMDENDATGLSDLMYSSGFN